jgi:signal peptidase I
MSIETTEPGSNDAYVATPRSALSQRKRRHIIAALLFVVFVLFLTTSFRLAVVRGDSMLPSYHDGQLVLVNRFGLLGGPLRPGDVVLVNIGHDALIKRIAYLPGQTINETETPLFRRVKDYFNVTPPPNDDLSVPKLTVPPGYIVVLGDNRRVSEDSRLFGPIAEHDIIGRVINTPSMP